MDKMVNMKINGISASVPSDYTIMEAAKSLGIKIPRLCFLKGVNENASCRVCVVEIKGLRTLKNSCSVKVNEGMEVQTNTPRIRKAVKATLELLAANHHFQCWKCSREHNCEFINLLRSYNINNEIYINQDFSKKEEYINNLSASIVIDTSKCVL
jgi:NADH dehydrogenase/NADH:ubiquinone oxidoreductase subunit G